MPMISLPLVAFSAGSLLLTSVGLYIGWRSYRVYLLRLELLTIRNRLWDVAQATGSLDNDVYRERRSSLNLLIQYAHRVDVLTMVLCPVDDVESQPEALDLPSPAMQQAMDDAVCDAGSVLNQYVVWHRPFTGVLLFKCIAMMKFCNRVFKFVAKTQWLVRKEHAAKVSEFGRHSRQSSIHWLKNNGPMTAFAAGALVSTIK